MQQIEFTKDLADAIGPYKVGVATYIVTAIAMWVGSKIKHYLVKI